MPKKTHCFDRSKKKKKKTTSINKKKGQRILGQDTDSVTLKKKMSYEK